MNSHLPFALLLTAVFGIGASAAPIPADARVGGFAIGCQAYSFNRFSVFEAIEKTELTGSKVIEFYPGQKLSREEPGVKWDHNASDEVIARVKEKLAKHGVRAVNYGVVEIPADETKARVIFDFARKMGFYAVTTESTGSLDTIEKMVREFDIRCGFHEHARQPNNPSYRVWDPNYVRDLVKDRDARIGACADIGHWQTSGIKAIDGLRILSGRLISLHVKDRLAIGPGQHDCIFGTGISDIGGVLSELKRQRFEGNLSIEYEFNWDNSVADIAQCVGFVRGWSAGRESGAPQ
ncbi:MAG: sugar phosphate isomerase/epimerase [Pedosphaera sp.]|nr:sugar phosphate isomerase/epimerase [Pedosphaera sp.]